MGDRETTSSCSWNNTRDVLSDRTTIDEHVAEFDQRWNFMKGTRVGGFSNKVTDFGEALTSLAKSEQDLSPPIL